MCVCMFQSKNKSWKEKHRGFIKKQSTQTRHVNFPRWLEKEDGVSTLLWSIWMTCLMLPRPELSCLYIPFVSYFLHGLYSSTGHFADTFYLFLVLRAALRSCLLPLYSFYMKSHLDQGSHGGNRAPEEQRSNRGWVTSNKALTAVPLAAAGSAALEEPAFPSNIRPVHLLGHAVLSETSRNWRWAHPSRKLNDLDLWSYFSLFNRFINFKVLVS